MKLPLFLYENSEKFLHHMSYKLCNTFQFSQLLWKALLWLLHSFNQSKISSTPSSFNWSFHFSKSSHSFIFIFLNSKHSNEWKSNTQFRRYMSINKWWNIWNKKKVKNSIFKIPKKIFSIQVSICQIFLVLIKQNKYHWKNIWCINIIYPILLVWNEFFPLISNWILWFY